MPDTITAYQAKYFAYELQRSYANDHVGKLAGLLFDAQVEPKPHQIDAALFALQSPFLPGVILADEVGLGKTIEAGIVISQYWAERRRRILIIAPSSLRQQWQQELYEKFLLPSVVLNSANKAKLLAPSPAGTPEILICSYEFASRHKESLLRPWDLVVADEAHRLRNFWTGKNKAPDAVAKIMRGAHRSLLLTATPLQNRLEELYGLVSVFAPDYFHSLSAFRERYIKNRQGRDDDDLVDRVALVSKRTLRKDADKYIHFTERLPLTVEFTPSEDEKLLYDLVNEYLLRPELYAFADSQRHLSALIIRKRLGSSTYAVASTLEHIADRLAGEIASGRRRDSRGGLVVADFGFDDELPSDLIEESEAVNGDSTNTAPPSDHPGDAPQEDLLKAMNAEVTELREYAALARSITVNQKAVKLIEALELGFERLRELGAAEKTIIFTESTKTQDYIARTLREAGWGDGLVLFNGSNTSPEQTSIYQTWLEANKDSDLVTGIAAADRRKALVDYFRDEGRIMVATEAAAEGINLQFCSMLVNYDLPWNPQRVEQRIGRVHRFGQKHNVVVVNFANKGNRAEARILELLADKFKLFSSVFGASDEVLGAIEDGFDFEKRINDILTRCRTADELDAAFKELEEQYAVEISSEMENTRARVFDNLDPHVQERLKAFDEQSEATLNRFERLLLAVTRLELDGSATFEGDGRHFILHSSPVDGVPTGPYYFKSQPLENAHQYRYSSPLAEYVLTTALAHPTPSAELVFSLGESERVPAALKELEGQSGVLSASLVTFRMRVGEEDLSESYMLSGALTDGGRFLDEEYVLDMMELTCADETQVGEVAADGGTLDSFLEQRLKGLQAEVQTRNSRYLNEQEELIARSLQDRRAEHEAIIRDYTAKEREARKQAKHADDPMEQLRLKKEARRLRMRIDNADDDFRAERKKLEAEADKLLEMLEQSLKGTQEVEPLFVVRWRVVA